MSIKDIIKYALQSLSKDQKEKVNDNDDFKRLEEVKQLLAKAVEEGPKDNIFADESVDLGQRDMDKTLHSLFDDSGKDLEGNKGKSIYNTGEFKVLSGPAVYQNVEIDENSYSDERGKVLGNASFAEQTKHAAPDYNPEAILGNTPRKLKTNAKSSQSETNESETKIDEVKGNPEGIVHSFVKKTSHTRTITHIHLADGSVERKVEDKNVSEDIETQPLANGNLQSTTNTSTRTVTTTLSGKKASGDGESFAELFEKREYDFSPEALGAPIQENRALKGTGSAVNEYEKNLLANFKREVKEQQNQEQEESFAALVDSYALPNASAREQQNLASKRKKAKMFAPSSKKLVKPEVEIIEDEQEIVAYNVDQINRNNKSFNDLQAQANKNREIVDASFAQMFEAQPQNVPSKSFVEKDSSFRNAFKDVKPLNSGVKASLEQQRRQAEHQRRALVGLKSGKEILEQEIAHQDYQRLSQDENVIFSDINMRFNEFNYENARFAIEGLDADVSHAFFNGLLPIDQEVDLHKCTTEELKSIIPAVVKDSWRNNEFVIRFITGHGKGVLKQSLPNYLVQYERVAAFYPNKENNGKGRTNGFVVLLRNYDKETASRYAFSK
ncbi:hypothetical protein CJP74_03655 [Psittacicella melopsittaci]|uniref:Smr domain-containing protein n=1 Tax=Psittacicella melopsittaci TaxID=2028576 RepID=A0A3A1Y9J2_9GAMM|nr:Smr/MutS family protein [Psittacicella melopsittaci]RIY32804.1 hypothetical protein CJP74_03655 [Psittacicella melopsittaci]